MAWDLLEGLDEHDRQLVLGNARRRTYRAREVLFHEGDSGDSLYLIESGRVVVRVTTSGGDTATLSVVGPGEALGEMALLRRSAQRTATVIALEPSVALTLHRDVFATLRRDHPRVERVLVGILAARVDRLSRQLAEALYLPVDTRVARRVLDLARLYGGGPGPVLIPLTQDDIAGLAGTTRPTANVALRELQRAGALALSRGRIEVLDQAVLARYAR